MNLKFNKQKELFKVAKDLNRQVPAFKIVISKPPEYILVNSVTRNTNGNWKKVKVKKYLTANLWYGSDSNKKTEIEIRTQIKHKIKLFLLSLDLNIPEFKSFPLRIIYTYYGPKGAFDLQNKLFFWAKLFEDFLQKQGKIPNDNINYIQSERYEYIESTDKRLEIEIKTINAKTTY